MCSTTTTRSLEARQARGRSLQLIGVGHQLEHETALLEGLEHLGFRQRAVEPAHRSDPAEP